MRSTACRTRAGDRRRSTARRRPSRPSCGTRPGLVARVDVFGRAVVVAASDAKPSFTAARATNGLNVEPGAYVICVARFSIGARSLSKSWNRCASVSPRTNHAGRNGPRRHRHDPAGVRVEHHDRAGVRLQAAIRALVVHGPRALDARPQLLLGDPLDVEVEREPEVGRAPRAGDRTRGAPRRPSSRGTAPDPAPAARARRWPRCPPCRRDRRARTRRTADARAPRRRSGPPSRPGARRDAPAGSCGRSAPRPPPRGTARVPRGS